MTTIFYKGYNILIEQDSDVSNPYQDFDQLSDLLIWKWNWDLDSRGKGAREFNSALEVVNAFNIGDIVWFAWVEVVDGSYPKVKVSESMNFKDWDNHRWDGVVYVTKEKAGEEYSTPQGKYGLCKIRKIRKQLERAVLAEIATLNQYLEGDVWGYSVGKVGEANTWKESCWGFYGEEYCLREAREVVDRLVAEEEVRLAASMDEYWGWSGALMFGGREVA